MKPTNPIFEYHKAITSKKIPACKYIKKIFKILTSGITRGVWTYDAKRANKAIAFIENFCHHSEGRNDLFKLELWQKAITAAIFGILDTNGNRQFREVLIIVGRKNGKTLFASALIAYMAYLDGEYGAKIYCIAPKLEQADKVFDGFHQIVLQDDELAAMAKKRRGDIYIAETNTSVKPIAFNSKKSDGFNPHFVVCDEVQAWSGVAGLKQYEVLKSAFGARRQPLILSISTAGYINDSIYDELMKRATAYLNGSSLESRLLPFLFIIDDIEKCFDITELYKSNPNLDVSVSREFLIEESKIAQGSLPKRAEFLTKYCNIKQNASVAWLSHELVDGTSGDGFVLSDFRGCYCVGGIDLSQTTDLTAASVVIERGGKLYTFCKFFMPSERLQAAIDEDGVPYDIYLRQNILQLSGDHFVNYKDVVKWFLDLLKVYKIKPLKIGYDRYSASYLVEEMRTLNFHVDDVFQGENLTPVINDIEGLIKDKTLLIGDNNLLKAHMLNMALKINTVTGRKRPVKIERHMRIDGFLSVIDAMTVRQKYYSEIGKMLQNKPR